MPRIKSVIFGPSIPEDPLVTIVPSLVRQVFNFIPVNPPSNFLHFLNSIFIDHDTQILSYFNDKNLLIHLAFMLHPQFGDNALEKLTRDYMEIEEEEAEVAVVDTDIPEEVPAETEDSDVDIEVLDEAPAVFKTPGRKKKPLKVKEKLDDSFLRRSKRISNKLQGFEDEESARKAKAAAVNINAEEDAADEVIEPMPQAIIPPGPSGSGVAPYLGSDILRGIAEGFLQIQPESVLAALLKKDNLDG